MLTKQKNLMFLLIVVNLSFTQTNPAITSWIQNHDGETGRHYVSGNPTPIIDNVFLSIKEADAGI